jgi:hypothetical protein
MTNDVNLSVILIFMFLGAILISGLWLIVLKIFKNNLIKKTRKDLETRLPFTIEEIEAEKELARATHIYELKLLEVQIAMLKQREAQANLKTSNALNRINKLNDRVERLRLELAAGRKEKQINDLSLS